MNEYWCGNPATVDYITFHAAERPEAAALLDNGRTITYGKLARDIRKFTQGVREFGIPRDGTVAVGCEDPYLHIVILLACDRLGLATTSVASQENQSVLPLLEGVDLLLSEFPLPQAQPSRRRDLDRAWVDRVRHLPDAEEASPFHFPPESALRILRTSGTTGMSKRLRLTRRMFDAWVNRRFWFYGLGPRSRVMITMPLAVGAMHAEVCACLSAGGTVVRENRMEIPEALRRNAVTHVTLLPTFLRAVLGTIPAHFERLPELVISTFGGAVSPSLRADAVERLCGAVCDMYGCNEVGFIASNGLYRTGKYFEVWPGIALEVVDDVDRPLPTREQGRLRVRTEAIFAGYIDDPEATRRMLHDGWFYPGDIGVLHAPRSLELLGRADDLLNVEGHKLSPEPLEELIRTNAALKEVAVGVIAREDGAAELFVAVADADVPDAELMRRVESAVAGAAFRKFLLVRLSRIPRNLTGKIERNALKSEIAVVAARQASTRHVPEA
ncbi:MAG TPA: class I adenylate-forming enzyme family protein [Stellaceae bacterium]|nr:class I adenylate-forming enzyme family protein [Stellaceae bacterium]